MQVATLGMVSSCISSLIGALDVLDGHSFMTRMDEGQ